MADHVYPSVKPSVPAVPVVVIGAAVCLIGFKSMDLGSPPPAPRQPAKAAPAEPPSPPQTPPPVASPRPAPVATPRLEDECPQSSSAATPAREDSKIEKPNAPAKPTLSAGQQNLLRSNPPKPLLSVVRPEPKPAAPPRPTRQWVPTPGETLRIWTDRGPYDRVLLISASPGELVGRCEVGEYVTRRFPVHQVWGIESRGITYVPRNEGFVDAIATYRFDTRRRKFEKDDRAPEIGRPATFSEGFSRLPGRVAFDPESRDLWISVALRDDPARIDPEDVGNFRTSHLSFHYDPLTGKYRVESEQVRADRRHKEQREYRSRQFFEQQYRQGRDVPLDLFLPPGIQPPAPSPKKAS